MSMKLKSHLPVEAVVPEVSTTSPFIDSRRLAEYPVTINGNYKYSTNNMLEFRINSNNEFADFANSYIRCDLTTDLLFEGSDDPTRYLSEGGAHSLINRVVISTGGGVQLEEIADYNKWYALMSNFQHGKEYVDMLLAREGDSVDGLSKAATQWGVKSLTGTGFAYDATGGASEKLLTGTGTAFTNEVQVGDLIVIIDNDGATAVGEVGSITSDTVINLLGASADSTGNSAYVIPKRAQGLFDPARKRVANTDNSVLSFQINCGLFSMSNLFPLFLLQGGLRVQLYLERPEYCLVSPNPVVSAGFTGADYTISNAFFVCEMFQPDDELRNMYVSLYRERGISYPLMGYRHHLAVISAGSSGTQSIQIQENVRSAKHLLMKVQDERANTVSSATTNSGKSSFTCDCVAQGIKGEFEELQVEIGSSRFPQARPMDLTSVDNSEVLAEAHRCFGELGYQLGRHRFHPWRWCDVAVGEYEYEQGRLGGRAQSDRLAYAIQLARDNAPMSGQDCRLNPIVIRPKIGSAYQIADMDGSNAANSALYLHCWVGHDYILNIGADGTQVSR